MKIISSRTLNGFLMLLVAGALITSCSDSGTGVNNEPAEVQVQIVEDIPADTGQTGQYIFYSLREGTIVQDSASTHWDLAFAGTTVLTNSGTSGPGNGGAVVLDMPFEELDTAPAEGYAVDSGESPAIPTGSDNGWYHYTGNDEPQHAILPIEGKTIVVKTADGKYAKVEILSYYQGNPDTSTEEFANMGTRPPSRFYTFKYAVQVDGSRSLK